MTIGEYLSILIIVAFAILSIAALYLLIVTLEDELEDNDD